MVGDQCRGFNFYSFSLIRLMVFFREDLQVMNVMPVYLLHILSLSCKAARRGVVEVNIVCYLQSP